MIKDTGEHFEGFPILADDHAPPDTFQIVTPGVIIAVSLGEFVQMLNGPTNARQALYSAIDNYKRAGGDTNSEAKSAD